MRTPLCIAVITSLALGLVTLARAEVRCYEVETALPPPPALVPRPRSVVLSTNPLTMTLGFFDATLEVAVLERVSFRADFTLYDFDSTGVIDFAVTGFEANLSALYYPGRVFDGLFIEGGFLYRQVETGGYEGTVAATTTGPQALLGFQHVWDSGLSLAIAAGGGFNVGEGDEDADWFSEGELFVNGYMRVGLAF
jgi:hypothetical protein